MMNLLCKFLLLSVRYSVMTAYKKHLIQTKHKELLNAVSLWSDIEKYCSMDSGPESQSKKDDIAASILRSVTSCNVVSQLTLYIGLYISHLVKSTRLGRLIPAQRLRPRVVFALTSITLGELIFPLVDGLLPALWNAQKLADFSL